MNWTTLPVVSGGHIEQPGLLRLRQVLREIASGQDKRRSNYSEERVDLSGHLEFDLLLDAEGDLVTFCGLYNGGRYPPGVYRCLNRVYIHPRWRSHGAYFPAFATRYLLPLQLERAGSRAKFVFVSRENPKARRFLRSWSDQRPAGMNWIVSNHMVQVARAANPACFQVVAFSPRERNFEWHTASVLDSEWTAANRISEGMITCAKPTILGT